MDTEITKLLQVVNGRISVKVKIIKYVKCG